MNEENINTVITKDVTLKPRPGEGSERLKKARAWLVFLTLLNYFHWPLLIGGTIVAVIVYLQDPTTPRLLALGLYAILWVTKILSMLQKRQYGVVRSAGGHLITNAVVQLTNNTDGIQQHVLSTITDTKGRFILLAPSGEYELTVTKDGFRPYYRYIDGQETNLTVRLEG